MDLNFKRKNNFLDYKKYIFEQRTEKEIKSIAISWQQDLIAIGSIGNAYVYNYSDVLKRESLDANLWLKLKRRSAAILDWNNDLDYILATACQTNCTIFDCNYNREICTFDVSNSITSLAWSKKNNAFLAYSTYDKVNIIIEMKVYNIIKIIKFPFTMGIDPVLCRKQILYQMTSWNI